MFYYNKFSRSFFTVFTFYLILSVKAQLGSRFDGFPAPGGNGTCFKRVQYDADVAEDISQGIIEIVSGSRETVFLNGNPTDFLTVLDCCNGFARNRRTRQCEPFCQGGCVGGTCLGANDCRCDPGWEPKAGICKPICRTPCQENAYCFSPDHCECKLFYENIQGECKPICPDGCVLGECIAPKECRCFPGFVMGIKNKCEPYCESGCPHGECTDPEICTCYKGYKNPEGNPRTCEAECKRGCNDGQCIAPDVCICQPGHIRNSDDRCEPVCSDGCEHGICIAPENCVCHVGYVKDQRSGVCSPKDNATSNFQQDNPNLLRSLDTRNYRPDDVSHRSPEDPHSSRRYGPDSHVRPDDPYNPRTPANREDPYSRNRFTTENNRDRGRDDPYNPRSPSNREDPYSRDRYTTDNNRDPYSRNRDRYTTENPYGPRTTSSEDRHREDPYSRNRDPYSTPRPDDRHKEDPYSRNRDRYTTESSDRSKEDPYSRNKDRYTTENPYDPRTPSNEDNPKADPYSRNRDPYTTSRNEDRPKEDPYSRNRDRYTTESPDRPKEDPYSRNRDRYTSQNPHEDPYSRNRDRYTTENPYGSRTQAKETASYSRTPSYGSTWQDPIMKIPGSNSNPSQEDSRPKPPCNQQLPDCPGGTRIQGYIVDPNQFRDAITDLHNTQVSPPIYPNRGVVVRIYGVDPNQQNPVAQNPAYTTPSPYRNTESFGVQGLSDGNRGVYPNQENNRQETDYQQHIDKQSHIDPDEGRKEEARCDFACYNGECTGRNKCTCHRGYRINPINEFNNHCVPVCYGECKYGTCTAPNVCTCKPGYTRDRYAQRGSQQCVLERN